MFKIFKLNHFNNKYSNKNYLCIYKNNNNLTFYRRNNHSLEKKTEQDIEFKSSVYEIYQNIIKNHEIIQKQMKIYENDRIKNMEKQIKYLDLVITKMRESNYYSCGQNKKLVEILGEVEIYFMNLEEIKKKGDIKSIINIDDKKFKSLIEEIKKQHPTDVTTDAIFDG